MSESKETITKVPTSPDVKKLIKTLNDCRRVFDESSLSNAKVFQFLATKYLQAEVDEWKAKVAERINLSTLKESK